MLDDLELESVRLALEPLRLGRALGSGEHTATFTLLDSETVVVKVFRKHAARHLVRAQAAHQWSPRVLAHKSAGLLDVLLVERVKGLATGMHDFSRLQAEQLLDMLVRLPKEHGLVNLAADDARTFGFRRNGEPVLLDTHGTLRFDDLSETEQLQAGALHCGLVSTCGLPEDSPLFQHFASVCVTGRARPHPGIRYRRADLADVTVPKTRLSEQLLTVARQAAEGPLIARSLKPRGLPGIAN